MKNLFKMMLPLIILVNINANDMFSVDKSDDKYLYDVGRYNQLVRLKILFENPECFNELKSQFIDKLVEIDTSMTIQDKNSSARLLESNYLTHRNLCIYDKNHEVTLGYDKEDIFEILPINNNSNQEELIYSLNDISITDEAIISKIKGAIVGLEDVKTALDELENYDGDKLRQEYDGVKKLLDDSKKLIDDVKQAIDNSNPDESLKKEADNIKKAMDDVKKLIDDYKKDADNSPEAIDDIKNAVDGVISMMRSGESSEVGESMTISIKQGRNTISGNIDITKLPDAVHSIWIVEGGNWFGYSPYIQINALIEAKYALIDENIRNYKGALVYAVEDGEIETMANSSDESIEHTYPRGYSIHGTDGTQISGEDVVCDDGSKLVMVAKVSGETPSVFVSDREIEGMDNFVYLGENDGYYVLCDKED